MQSVVLYGRIVARALATGFNSEFQLQLPWTNSSCAQSQPRSLHLISASCGLSKSHSSAQVTTKWSFGDDACFIAGQKLGDVIGVADGVGGWRDYGVDPSKLPKSLMSTCQRLVETGQVKPSQPTNILINSYKEILESKEPLIGSCTACLVALHRDEKTLYTSNLGDSGFRVIRDGQVLHRSEEQQHYFNTPFQLAVVPTTLEGMVLSDKPEAAESSSFGVQAGDIILVGTDGLFDNMHEETILKHVSKLKDCKFESLQKIANAMAHHAHQLALDPDFMSPFALNAAQNGIYVKGGKPDDITVLLARVSDEES